MTKHNIKAAELVNHLFKLIKISTVLYVKAYWAVRSCKTNTKVENTSMCFDDSFCCNSKGLKESFKEIADRTSL